MIQNDQTVSLVLAGFCNMCGLLSDPEITWLQSVYG